MTELLRRAWDTLDTFKQAYPENWHEEDEQVLKDLLRADLKLSGVKLKWVDLTKEEKDACVLSSMYHTAWSSDIDVGTLIEVVSAKLREKNNG